MEPDTHPAVLLGTDADVVPIPLVTPCGEVVAHRTAARLASHQALEQSAVLVAAVLAAGVAVPPQQALHPGEQVLVDNGVVFAFVDLALIGHLAEVDDVRQQLPEGRLVELRAAPPRAFGRLVSLCLPTQCL